MFSRTLAEFLIVGVSSLCLTAILSHFIIPILVAKKAGQPIRKEGPKSHYTKAGTPTMGGIAFIFSILIIALVAVVVYAIRGEQNRFIPLGLTLALAVFNGMIGFFDDYRKLLKKQNEGLKAWQKFALQVVAAVAYIFLLVKFGGIDTTLHIPFIDKTVELGIIYYVFAGILIVGVVNSVNLTDGLDGLASSVTLIVGIFFSVAAVAVGSRVLGLIGAATIGATAGFLVYNFYPARVFMGDTGSLFLGGLVVGATFVLDEPMVIFLVGIIYLVEAMSDIIQVGVFKLSGRKKRVFKMAPIHHHFEQCGWSEIKVVAVFSLVTFIFCVIAYLGIFVII